MNPPPTDPTTPAAVEAAAGSLSVRPGEDPWTAEEVAEVHASLRADRDRLVSEIAQTDRDLAAIISGGADGAGNDQADVGANSVERDAEMSMAHNQRELLRQVERAEARLADGTYGDCESCGKPIGKGRLSAFPRAVLCVECKQREERR